METIVVNIVEKKLAQRYAEMWNLDFKPNKEIWEKIECQGQNEDRIGSINMPGLLRYMTGYLVSNSITALERRKLRNEVKGIIKEMKRVEQQILF